MDCTVKLCHSLDVSSMTFILSADLVERITNERKSELSVHEQSAISRDERHQYCRPSIRSLRLLLGNAVLATEPLLYLAMSTPFGFSSHSVPNRTPIGSPGPRVTEFPCGT